MDTKKRIRYIENLYGGLHTVAGISDNVNMEYAAGVPIVKSCFRKKIRGRDEYEYYLQLNPNKATNEEIISSYSQYQQILQDFIQQAACPGFKITRADFAFNSDDEGDFLTFRKLNKLLICCLAHAYQVKNCYETMDLWSGRPLNVAIKSGHMEAENYNKDAESNGKARSKNRIEVRSKRITCELPEEFTETWCIRLDQAVEQFQAVQDRSNHELLQRWAEDQEKNRKDRDFLSITQFVLGNRDKIYTRRQLESLLGMIGSKNPKTTAKKLKSKHRIEFFSRTDLKVITCELKKIIIRYFTS